MDRKAELIERNRRLSETRSLRMRAERQRELFRLRPFADASNKTETFLIAGAYHDLIWRGVPREFSSRAPGNLRVFESARPPYSAVSFRDYPPELMLDDILKGLIFLEELYRDEIRQLKRLRPWWRR